jgi:hypothetical protein
MHIPTSILFAFCPFKRERLKIRLRPIFYGTSLLGRLQPRPYRLATLPRISRIERLPTTHRARLHAHHLLVLLISKVTHPLGFLGPRVPQRDRVQTLAGDR